jgi:hypothetical protein
LRSASFLDERPQPTPGRLRSRENHPNHVIPAKAGIHFVRNVDPRLRGGDEKDFHFLGRAKGPWKSVKEYNEKVEYIHLNPVRAGLVTRPQDWPWSSYNEYASMSAEEQKKRCGLIVDRVRMPSDPRARI